MIPSHTRPTLSIDTSPISPQPLAQLQPQVDTLNHHTLHVTDLTISIPGSTARAPNPSSDEPGPSRWKSREFALYAAVFLLVVPWMVYLPIRLSQPSNPNYILYAGRLSPGWMFGRRVDASDPQYRSFRSNLIPLILLAGTHLGASHLGRRLGAIGETARSRATFTAGFATLVIIVLHGSGAVKVAAILGVNYYAARISKPTLVMRVWPLLLVIGNMAVLFLNERYDGYRFGELHTLLAPLDGVQGLLPRWHVGFNITMLRIVSFALDYHWRDASTPSSGVPEDYRRRTKTPLPESDYSLVNYIAYCLYPPLYIGGPIITFNDFCWQIRHPVLITTRERVSYAIRFVACLLTMEAVLHTMYVVAIKDARAWDGGGPADLSMIGFWNLVVVWLKLLIPWRFFRLWALLDGVDPPENMIRCVANNYSTLGFWRSWHRSYNLWIVRYIYVPLGGAKNVVVATTLVFTFVALWHDLSFRLLAWGWLVSLFIVPELLARHFVPASKYGHESWYRHVCAVGGVFNILLMMSANLVGFVLGLDGMRHLAHELISTWHGWAFTLFASGCLFVAVQVMFEYREEERRRGIDRRC